MKTNSISSMLEKGILVLLFAFIAVITSSNGYVSFGGSARPTTSSGSGRRVTPTASLSATSVTIPLGGSVEVSINNPGNEDTFSWLAAGTASSGSGSSGGKVTVSKYGITNRIYGAAEGSAIVYVYKNGKSFGSISCTITGPEDQKHIPIVDIVCNDKIYIKGKGITVQATRKIYPLGATEKDLIWKSSNHAVAMVNSNGSITGKGNGVCTVTVSNKEGTVRKYITVTVGNGTLSNPSLDKTNISGAPIGESEAIQVLNLGGLLVASWTSTNPNVVSVTSSPESSSCVVHFNQKGTASIICTLSNGKVLTCGVTVEKAETTTVERVQLPNGEVIYPVINLAKEVGYTHTNKNKNVATRVDDSSKTIIIGFGGDGERKVDPKSKNIIVNDERITNLCNYIYFGSSAFYVEGNKGKTADKIELTVEEAIKFVNDIIGDNDPNDYTIIVYGFSRGGSVIDAMQDALKDNDTQSDYVVMADATIMRGKESDRVPGWKKDIAEYEADGTDVIVLSPKGNEKVSKAGRAIGEEIMGGENDELSGATFQLVSDEKGRSYHGLTGELSANVVYDLVAQNGNVVNREKKLPQQPEITTDDQNNQEKPDASAEVPLTNQNAQVTPDNNQPVTGTNLIKNKDEDKGNGTKAETNRLDGKYIIAAVPSDVLLITDSGKKVNTFSFSQSTTSGKVGTTIDLGEKLKLSPSDAKTVIKWETSNTDAITLSSNGVATLNENASEVVVKATDTRTEKTATIKLSVTGTKQEPIAQEVPNDVSEDAWYLSYVLTALQEGYFTGTQEGKFDPESKITRGMFVTVLSRFDKSDISGHKNSFDDVDLSMYYKDAIAWAADSGIVKGTGNGTFNPDGLITREEMAVMMFNYIGARHKSLLNISELKYIVFNDDANISSWAKDAIYTLVTLNVLNGDDNNYFSPKANVTRAQAATLLVKLNDTCKKAVNEIRTEPVKEEPSNVEPVKEEPINTNVVLNKYEGSQFSADKPTISRDTYTAEQWDSMERELADRVKEAGFGTRSGVVAAALYVCSWSHSIPYRGTPYDSSNMQGTYQKIGINREWGKAVRLKSDKTYNGKTYKAGGLYTNGLDCGGFVNWAMVNGGVTPEGQYNGQSTYPYRGETSNKLVKLEKSNAMPGDLVFTPKNTRNISDGTSHIALIVGEDENNWYIAEEQANKLRLRTQSKTSNSRSWYVWPTEGYYKKMQGKSANEAEDIGNMPVVNWATKQD